MLEPVSEQSTPEEALFSHLAPPDLKPSRRKSINLTLKQKIDHQLQSKTALSRKIGRKNGQAARKARALQLEALPVGREADIPIWSQAERGYRQEVKSQEQQEAIVISDDEENKRYNDYEVEEGLRTGEGYFNDGLNWRERRKIDRLMERGMRYFRQGKPRDQLSFKVFNAIEAYFK